MYAIRLAKREESKELSRLKRVVWEETYRGIYPDEKLDNYDYDEHEKKFERIIDNPDVRLYVVSDNGRLVGYMDYGVPFRKFLDYEQEIGLLYLKKECKGKGIGRELFNLGYNGIKNNGYNRFFISCNKYNVNALKFYEKMGGRVVHIDDDNDEDKSIVQVKFEYSIK